MSIQNFALIDGKPAFIKNYRHLVGNYKERPIAICPIKGCGCEMEMVLPKDETIMRSHFRHKSKSVADHSPESIWHCDVKYHIAEQLKQKAKIKIKWKCKSGFCKSKCSLPSLLSDQPNYIDVDSRKIGKFLPDITLYHDNKPLAAIEVFNTHESSDEKIAFYDEQKLPWFEILVQSFSNYEKIMDWKGGDGLQKFISRHYYPETLPRHCPSCEQAIADKERHEREKAERAAREQAEYQARRRKAEIFKQKVGEKLLPLLTSGKSISLDFKLICSDCRLSFPQYLIFRDVTQFAINDYIPHVNEICDIALYDRYNDYCGCILIKKKHSSNDEIKDELMSKSDKNNKAFIEIDLKNNKFYIIDSSLHGNQQKLYTCNACKSLRAEKERIRLNNLRTEIQARELEVKRKLEEKIAGITNEINNCQSQINNCLERIRLSRSNDEKETARQVLHRLKNELNSLKNRLP